MYNRLVEFAEKKCEIHTVLLSFGFQKNHSKSHTLIHSIQSTLVIKSFLLSWSTLVFVVRLFSGLKAILLAEFNLACSPLQTLQGGVPRGSI